MRRRLKPPDEAFQMAPMIDMVFLLLVFFMTVSTLAREARPETVLPVSQAAVVPVEAPPRDVITLLVEDGAYQLFWYNSRIERGDLEERLKSRKANDVSGVILRGSPETPWSEWKPVLDLLRRSGVEEITFAAFEA